MIRHDHEATRGISGNFHAAARLQKGRQNNLVGQQGLPIVCAEGDKVQRCGVKDLRKAGRASGMG